MDFPAGQSSQSIHPNMLGSGINVLEWPVQSTDLILIENIWLNLKKAVAK